MPYRSSVPSYPSPDREAQEAAFAHRCHFAFGTVYRELEVAFKIPCQAAHDPLTRTLGLDQNDQIIGIAGKAVSPPLQLQIELVQQDIGQQWREWSPLGRAHLAGFYVPTDEHPGAQVAPDQSQQPFIANGAAQQAHQQVMVDRVEELGKVDVRGDGVAAQANS